MVEVDFYHSGSLLAMDDDALIAKVTRDLATMVPALGGAAVVDAAVIRLPNAVNWYLLPRQSRHHRHLTVTLVVVKAPNPGVTRHLYCRYFPGSYASCPATAAEDLSNAYTARAPSSRFV